MTKSNRLIYTLLAIVLLFPVIYIGNMRIELYEIIAFLYLIIMIINKKNKFNQIERVYLFYFVLYGLIVFLTSIKYNLMIDNSNLNTLRKILISFVYFEIYKENIKNINMYKIILIMFIPMIILLFQVLFYDFKIFTYDLYKPTYYYNPYTIGYGQRIFNVINYRSCSVFKDFFTFSVYSIFLSILIIYNIITKHLRRRTVLIILYISVFILQIYVARFSLLMIPIMSIILLALILIRQKDYRKLFSVLFYAILLASIVIVTFYYISNNANLTWASEILNLFSGNVDEFSSYKSSVMNNTMFINIISKNVGMLFIPMHSYDNYIHKFLTTTDNYYFQEVIRYGIYGIIVFVIFIVKIFKIIKRNIVLVTITLALVISNYKGGNTFFMDRNLAIYPLIFTYYLYQNGRE